MAQERSEKPNKFYKKYLMQESENKQKCENPLYELLSESVRSKGIHKMTNFTRKRLSTYTKLLRLYPPHQQTVERKSAVRTQRLICCS